MHSDAERTLYNLHVIGAVSQNDKLITNSENFDVHIPTTLRAFYRTWYGETRYQNWTRIRNCVRSAIGNASQYLEEAFDTISFQKRASKADFIALQHMRMIEGLRCAKKGICNLMQTYRDDTALNAQFSLLKQEIDDYLLLMDPRTRQLQNLLLEKNARHVVTFVE